MSKKKKRRLKKTRQRRLAKYGKETKL